LLLVFAGGIWMRTVSVFSKIEPLSAQFNRLLTKPVYGNEQFLRKLTAKVSEGRDQRTNGKRERERERELAKGVDTLRSYAVLSLDKGTNGQTLF
jgi:hypothetical protein